MKEQIQNAQHSDPKTVEKSSNRSLFLIIGAFVILIVFIFIKSQILGEKEPIAWLTDYDTAAKQAKAENKPLLLMFYKEFAPMYVDAKNNTYNNQRVKQFVELNFIPVAIECDAQPDLARRFNVGYYPTHYVKHPDRYQLFGPRKGWDPPDLFIKQMQILLTEMNKTIN